MSDKQRILVAEANRAVGAALRKYLESAGFVAEAVEGFDDALNRLRNWAPDLLMCGVIGLDGQTLCRKAKELSPGLPVVLVYPPDDEDPEARAAAAGADSLMIGPIKRGNVGATVRTLLKLRELHGQVSELQLELERRISAPSPKDRSTDTQVDFDFFKRLLLMEVKRSRRYRDPLSVLMVAVDDFRGTVGRLDARAQGRFMGQLLGLAVKSLRDIDLCVLYAQDKFLIFLPHTDQAGAQIVAGRLRERIEDFVADGPRITASIGIAAYDGSGATVSFGSLLKDATTALKKAQTEGGNRVEAGERQKPRARVSIGGSPLGQAAAHPLHTVPLDITFGAMVSLAAQLRLLALCSIAGAIPMVLWQRQLPRVALACTGALLLAAAGPRLMRRAGVALTPGLELLWLLPFAACWGPGEGLGLFERLYWWDELTHALGGLAVFALFLRWAGPRLQAGGAATLALGALVTLGLGGAWELFEFSLDTWLGAKTQRGLAETMGDLFFDLGGAALYAGLLLLKRLPRVGAAALRRPLDAS